MGTGEFNAGGLPWDGWGEQFDGQASHPVGSRNNPCHFMLRKPG